VGVRTKLFMNVTVKTHFREMKPWAWALKKAGTAEVHCQGISLQDAPLFATASPRLTTVT
jgi:hypothetical protein